MIFYAWIKNLRKRTVITVVIFLYFLIITLFLRNLDLIESRSESFLQNPADFLERKSPAGETNRLLFRRRSYSLIGTQFLANLRKMSRDYERGLLKEDEKETEVHFSQPKPLMEPKQRIDLPTGNEFVLIGEGAYAYSAFLDDRKEELFVRILTLMTEKAASVFLYCHVSAGGKVLRRQVAERYELCENHGQLYGGYTFSCPVSRDVDITVLSSISISFNQSQPVVTLPVHTVRPPEYRLAYLDEYPQSFVTTNISREENGTLADASHTAGISVGHPNSTFKKERSTNSSLTFAVCVSPLFGNISIHKFVEFVELSRLLGAEYFVFYNHSAPELVSDALRYYTEKKVASVLQWKLPEEISEVWYRGQLLANNDCLYRTMSQFDLVSFNDIDEFVVPHSGARTWKDAFSPLLTKDRCGFTFQSAFFEPDAKGLSNLSVLTPNLFSRTVTYSRILTKVMLCPWRVFEVGIHHISKQNREDWRPWKVDPGIAFLHHYRTCTNEFDTVINCKDRKTDSVIADRYLQKLSTNYQEALSNIFSQERLRT